MSKRLEKLAKRCMDFLDSVEVEADYTIHCRVKTFGVHTLTVSTFKTDYVISSSAVSQYLDDFTNRIMEDYLCTT